MVTFLLVATFAMLKSQIFGGPDIHWYQKIIVKSVILMTPRNYSLNKINQYHIQEICCILFMF